MKPRALGREIMVASIHTKCDAELGNAAGKGEALIHAQELACTAEPQQFAWQFG